MLCGTFLISFALLSFEITTVRTINFTVGPSYIYCAIALAMLGLSAAGSFLSLVDLRSLPVGRERILFWTCLAIAALLVASHFMAADTKAYLNEVIERAGRAGDPGVRAALANIVRALLAESLPSAIRIGLVLSLPYFLFGGLLAYLFATSERKAYGRLYAADLIGAALGCIGAIVVMEVSDYALSVTAPAVVAPPRPMRRRRAGGWRSAAPLRPRFWACCRVWAGMRRRSNRRPIPTIWSVTIRTNGMSERFGATGTASPASARSSR
jgi:hypothetical protein